jgi:hypothetical protein
MRLSIAWNLNSLLRNLGSEGFRPYAPNVMQQLAKLVYAKSDAKTEFGGLCMTVGELSVGGWGGGMERNVGVGRVDGAGSLFVFGMSTLSLFRLGGMDACRLLRTWQCWLAKTRMTWTLAGTPVRAWLSGVWGLGAGCVMSGPASSRPTPRSLMRTNGGAIHAMLWVAGCVLKMQGVRCGADWGTGGDRVLSVIADSPPAPPPPHSGTA